MSGVLIDEEVPADDEPLSDDAGMDTGELDEADDERPDADDELPDVDDERSDDELSP